MNIGKYCDLQTRSHYRIYLNLEVNNQFFTPFFTVFGGIEGFLVTSDGVHRWSLILPEKPQNLNHRNDQK